MKLSQELHASYFGGEEHDIIPFAVASGETFLCWGTHIISKLLVRASKRPIFFLSSSGILFNLSSSSGHCSGPIPGTVVSVGLNDTGGRHASFSLRGPGRVQTSRSPTTYYLRKYPVEGFFHTCSHHYFRWVHVRLGNPPRRLCYLACCILRVRTRTLLVFTRRAYRYY